MPLTHMEQSCFTMAHFPSKLFHRAYFLPQQIISRSQQTKQSPYQQETRRTMERQLFSHMPLWQAQRAISPHLQSIPFVVLSQSKQSIQRHLPAAKMRETFK